GRARFGLCSPRLMLRRRLSPARKIRKMTIELCPSAAATSREQVLLANRRGRGKSHKKPQQAKPGRAHAPACCAAQTRGPKRMLVARGTGPCATGAPEASREPGANGGPRAAG